MKSTYSIKKNLKAEKRPAVLDNLILLKRYLRSMN